MTIDDLTSKQSDYAVFLPALSSYYAKDISGQQHDPAYIPANRVPVDFENGVEGLNWLNRKEAYFPYKWSLYSAGHANLDTSKLVPKDGMIRNRDRVNTFLLGDSGGFQIGKGIWEGDWKNPNCPKAQKKREQVLKWMDSYMDYGMCLDVPSWVSSTAEGRSATGINTYDEAVLATEINNDYFIHNRTGDCKFLNVLQGGNHTESNDWYERMKKYCDPKQYPGRHFNGWAMGGQNMGDVHLLLKRLVALKFDNLLEKGIHDWVHVLGVSKLEWALLLTDIQRAIRKHHNSNLTISFDCASPFIAASKGQIYYETVFPPEKKWSYRMMGTTSDKKYASDNRKLGDVLLKDGHLTVFEESPVSERLSIKDICYQGPGALNKLGKESKTAWDAFSYSLLMGHNAWIHINSVQEANRRYDNGEYPAVLSTITADKKLIRTYELTSFKDIVDAIFSATDRSKAEELVESYNSYWMSIIGARGNKGKKTVNSHTQFNTLFD